MEANQQSVSRSQTPQKNTPDNTPGFKPNYYEDTAYKNANDSYLNTKRVL